MSSRKIRLFTGKDCPACTPHRRLLELYSQRPGLSLKFDLDICSLTNDDDIPIFNATKPPVNGLPTTCFFVNNIEDVSERITGGMDLLQYEARVLGWINGG